MTESITVENLSKRYELGALQHETQLRGGTGIFTGSPPYVWISNQVGQRVMLRAMSHECLRLADFQDVRTGWTAAVLVTDRPVAYDAKMPCAAAPRAWTTRGCARGRSG